MRKENGFKQGIADCMKYLAGLALAKKQFKNSLLLYGFSQAIRESVENYAEEVETDISGKKGKLFRSLEQ